MAILSVGALVGCFIEHTQYYCNKDSDCTADPAVVFGNTGPATEIQTACVGTVALPAVSYSAYVGGSGTMNNLDLTGCTAAMLFANASGGDYSPVKGGAKPCTLVDQGTNVGAPDHDYAGTPRPQPIGGTDDVGAYEARRSLLA